MLPPSQQKASTRHNCQTKPHGYLRYGAARHPRPLRLAASPCVSRNSRKPQHTAGRHLAIATKTARQRRPSPRKYISSLKLLQDTQEKSTSPRLG